MFIPRSRSERTNIGVCSRSARSKARQPNSNIPPRRREAGTDAWCPRGERVGRDEVALRGAGRQPGGRPHALDVPDHHRDLGVVAEPDELGHQRDSRPRGGGHRPRPGPAGRQRHSHRRQLVLGLHHRESRLAVRALPMFVEETVQLFHHARGRGDRVPGRDAHAAEHGAECGSGIAVNEDLPAILVHPGHGERIPFRHVLARVAETDVHRPAVQLHGGLLALELLFDGAVDLLDLDGEKLASRPT